MTLDVTAYERVELVRECDWSLLLEREMRASSHEFVSGRKSEGQCFLRVYPPFAKTCDGLPTGLYRTHGRRMSFSAGSYTSYGIWREQLVELFAPALSPLDIWNDPRPTLPFLGLVNNADNQGFIGPVTSETLFHEFSAWRDAASRYQPKARPEVPAAGHNDGRMSEARTERFDVDKAFFLKHYTYWEGAFALAAGAGAVELH